MNSRVGAKPNELSAPHIFDNRGREVFFPAGLLGVSSCHQYRLERFKPDDGSDTPFFMLHALGQDLSFPLIHPSSISLDYQFPTSAELLSTLGAGSPDELIPLLIVTIRDRVEDITVNLQGPVIINPKSSLGLQLVIENYELRHPLLTREL